MKIIRGFKTELDPNNKQKTILIKSCGVARFTYNWGLQKVKETMEKKEKIPSFYDLSKQLNAIKKEEYPWMYEVSSYCSERSLEDLDKAFKNFFRKFKQKKSGKFKGKCGFPRFKSKSDGLGSFRMHKDVKISSSHIQLPRIGWIKLKRKDYLPSDSVRIISTTISEKAGHWFVSVQAEMNIEPNQHQKDDHSIVGVDLGIKTLAVVSDGTKYENPKALTKNLRKLRKLNKSLSRKQKGSKNRSKARVKLARLHYHISNIRSDTLHKITSQLTRTKSVVVIEDLNVSGMMKNRNLARSISDVGLYEFRRQLEYKGLWNNCLIIKADRFYPSSKRCSACGSINQELKLSDREWVCMECGIIHDRDENASKNLEQVAVSQTDTINACGEASTGLVETPNETSLNEAGTNLCVG